ncbi:M28 family metallopeptidase [soil metagenome]
MPILSLSLRRGALVTMLLAAACAGAGTQAETGGSPESGAPGLSATEAAATITPEDMHDRIAILAADSMGGRDTPSPGLEMTAAYLADEFRSFGLEPAGEDGTYLQRYPLPLRALDTTGVHFGTVNAQGEDNRMLEHGVDFFAAPATARPGVDMYHGRFAWVGRVGEDGLPAANYEGAVVMVSLPGAFDRDWRIGATRARQAAERAGAAALLVVLGPELPANAIGSLAELSTRPQRALVQSDEIPAFYVTRDAAEKIVEQEGTTLDALPESPAEPVVFQNARAHFAAEATIMEDDNPPNVVALLPGSDPQLRDTYVVFSAHMDHVGIGEADASGDSIYNGADDDASGTSALVEVAQAFAALARPPDRSLIFLAVSGEEKGLLGSLWFSEHPTVPIEDIVADINVDMIGRNAADSIVVIGQEYSSLGPLVQRVAAEHPQLGLTVAPDQWPEERFFFRSDHFSFARLEIPALFFFAGVHEDYHRPSDEVEKIDSEKAARVARLIFYTANAIAGAEEPPRWTAEGLAEVRALTR